MRTFKKSEKNKFVHNLITKYERLPEVETKSKSFKNNLASLLRKKKKRKFTCFLAHKREECSNTLPA